jgi:hypothetical protein
VIAALDPSRIAAMRLMVRDAILTESLGVKVAAEAVAVEVVVEETIVPTVIRIAMVHRK